VAFLHGVRSGSLVTNIPVMSEVAYMLGERAPEFLDWLPTCVVIDSATERDLPRISAFLRKYRDQEPDFADASLIALCERRGIERVATVDARDFAVYRMASGRALTLVF
jgi:hypothetical protein